ncbi:hypothetical protein CTRI78_v008857 [Colletotrichum trifolii]|uniref:Uncharacterized protein n=1 Tax=Colletotrichum trifolii TaxID=5466 RepID=A0A4R8QXS0_COLTR|nr:hypothetical protein CTRI78_v008857 [Colletotrichum trifolii]
MGISTASLYDVTIRKKHGHRVPLLHILAGRAQGQMVDLWAAMLPASRGAATAPGPGSGSGPGPGRQPWSTRVSRRSVGQLLAKNGLQAAQTGCGRACG